ncbi:insulinase family protein [Shewanella colwelliana]|uniref:insulinase family protein n=1 Tax=Shewanella colwelliana TaxID=23 RepID=UPI0022AF666C|nr:insulinase family protein [Shewanella colwelliana]MCZ4338985.1 insulinase family protein [Shewanella colwelliana]
MNRRLVCFYITLTGLLLGCQQTKLQFTEVEPARLPTFSAPSLAPKLATSRDNNLNRNKAQVYILSSGHQLHRLPGGLSNLSQLHLVAVSAHQPFNNLDILIKALNEKVLWLAKKQKLNCINSLSISASMHSISLSLRCAPSELQQATKLLADLWSPGSFDNLDLAKVRRELAIGKHMDAFSGNEIESMWADKILSENHPYTKALNNQAQQQALDLTTLKQLQQQVLSQSQWHLIIEDNRPIDADDRASLAQALQPLNNVFPTQKRPTPSFSPYGKTLYIIDAPGTVQIQVRVGYRLPLTVDTQLACQALSGWLGRSFSGRLYYDLREQRGLTYGIYGRCFDNPLARVLKFYGSTQLRHSGAFIRGIIDHLELAQTSMATPQEVYALNTYFQSQFDLMHDNRNQRLQRYIQLIVKQHSWQQLTQQQTALAHLDANQLNNMAKQVFSQPPVIVLRGDLAKISIDLQQKLPEWNIKTVTME